MAVRLKPPGILGGIYKRIFNFKTKDDFRKMNSRSQLFILGKWLGKKSMMREYTELRPDGSELRICVAESKKILRKNRTGLLWIPGGGYAIGAPEYEFMFADRFLEDGSAVMVMPDYMKSVEKPYPAALDDCVHTLKWMVENSEMLGIRDDQIFVGGDSAGGGLAVAVCLHARDFGDASIAFQMPLYPMLDDRHTKSSENNDAPIWNTEKNGEGNHHRRR